MSSFKEKAISLLFPRCCPVCDGIILPRGNLICPACFSKLSFVTSPTCKKCGKEIHSQTEEFCMDCKRHTRTFQWGIALLNYDPIAGKSMAKIKYGNKREYLDFYGTAIAKRYEKRILRMNPQMLIPVPVHPSRKRKRGFNQAEILAGILSENLAIPMSSDYLIRHRKTIPQKNLSPSERLKNLEQAFCVKNFPPDLKSVLLVDDIYTTGSTIEACARVLKKAGAEQIYFVSICIGQGQ